MGQFLKDYWAGLIVVIELVADMFLNLPEQDMIQGFSIWWVIFIVFSAIQIFKPQKDLREYKSNRGNLEIKPPLTESIIIRDIRSIQRDNSNISSTGNSIFMTDLNDAGTDPITYTYKFLLMGVENNPHINTENKIARDIRAELFFYKNGSKVFVQTGRWAFSEDKTEWYIGKEHAETTSLDIKCNGEIKSVIVAFRDEEDKTYRLERSSYKSDKFKNESLILSDNEYDVHIELKGNNVDRIDGWYKLYNSISRFELCPIKTPSYYKAIQEENNEC